MDIQVFPVGPTIGRLFCGGRAYRCALGRAGLSDNKNEGDGATPIGRFPLRQIMFRPDRVASFETALAMRPLCRSDGWCDDPDDPDYNHLIERPFQASHEIMWRDDHLYDLVVELGYNDAPVIAGRGSAVFMHVASPGYLPTEGCVALALNDLLAVIAECDPASTLTVNPASA